MILMQIKSKKLLASLAIVGMSVPATVVYASDYFADPLAGLSVGAGVVAGALVGALLATKMHLDR